MLVLRTIKGVLFTAVGGLSFAGVVLALAAAGLVLFILPGGIAILTLEFERAAGWLRHIRSSLLNCEGIRSAAPRD